MKTRLVVACILLTGTFFTAKAQTIIETSTLTSGGFNAGESGNGNTFYGYSSGKVTTGNQNTFSGHETGQANTTGVTNSFFGYRAGYYNTSGRDNTYLGYRAGGNNQAGNQNTFVGNYSGAGILSSYTTGSGNTFLGFNSGFNTMGSGNVFIGQYAGQGLAGSNLLVINNVIDNSAPLIWGDFALDQLKLNGKVAIGNGIASFPNNANGAAVNNYNLFVKGGILTEAVRVTLQSQWADYVFADDYILPSLNDVECYIAENGHLPNVPSAKEIANDGLELAEMAKIQQEKIEELTLYAIAQNKKIENLEQQLAELQELKALVKQMTEKK